MCMSNVNPSIYVACLASYNSGILYGAWIDATKGADYIQDEVQAMLKKSKQPNAEEWAIHDYEDFLGAEVRESMDFESVAALAEFIQEHRELGAEVLNNFGGNLDDATTVFEGGYYGEFESPDDFAEKFTQENHTVPEYLAFYIDYDKMASDLFINDFFYIKLNSNIHVFRYF